MIKVFEEYYDLNEYAHEVGFWSGAKDRWDKYYNDEQREYLVDYFNDLTNACDEGWTPTQINDFIWFDADEILEEAGLL